MSATFWKVFELAISVLENMLLLGFCMDFNAAAAERKTGEIFMVVRGAGRNDFSGAGKVSGDL
mgnify:CR=1 FL=1